MRPAILFYIAIEAAWVKKNVRTVRGLLGSRKVFMCLDQIWWSKFAAYILTFYCMLFLVFLVCCVHLTTTSDSHLRLFSDWCGYLPILHPIQ